MNECKVTILSVEQNYTYKYCYIVYLNEWWMMN